MLTKILLGSNLFHGVKGTKKKAKRQTKRKIIWLFAHLSVPLRRSYENISKHHQNHTAARTGRCHSLLDVSWIRLPAHSARDDT